MVATNVGGIPMQIEDGNTGFLIEPQDYDAAAERVLKILPDPDLGARLVVRERSAYAQTSLCLVFLSTGLSYCQK